MTTHRAFLAVLLSPLRTGACAGRAPRSPARPVLAAPEPQDTLVPIKGVVSGSPESVTFCGQRR